jgi:D-alanyl-D-alanine carboxypeptidase
MARRVAASLGLFALLSLLAACGSGSVAQDAKKAVSTATGAAKEQLAAATITTTTETVTQPAKTVTEPTKTVTKPARTQTVTRTETTTVHSNTTTVKEPTTTSGNKSSGIPGWGWALIGAGAVLLVVAIFMIGRSRGAQAREATSATDPSRPPDSAMPPRGPPEDPI